MTITGLQQHNRRNGILTPHNEANIKIGRGAGKTQATQTQKEDHVGLTAGFIITILGLILLAWGFYAVSDSGICLLIMGIPLFIGIRMV